MKIKIKLAIIPALTALLIAGCGGMYGLVRYVDNDAPVVFETNRFKITISYMSTGMHNTNYYSSVTVKNKTNRDQVFDTGEMELIIEKTGISYYSISKDKDSISLPKNMSDVILTSKLKAGRAIEGRIWFSTPPGKANADVLKLTFDGRSIMLKAK